MSQKTIRLVLIIGGAALLALSLGADALGLGSSAGMHWKQWSGTVAGAAALLAGLWLGRGKAQSK